MDNKTAGFSLIEMLVSIVIGMIVVAAASTMLVSTLKSQKDIAAAARLNQELGAVMAVMSNEIRRAGFSVCDESVVTCSEPPTKYDASAKDLSVKDDGDCIEYRYNADLNDTFNDLGEQRGFRFNNNDNTVQMGDISKNVACTDALTSTDWIDITDPDMITISALSFSTTGSKCRNMKTGGESWAVGDVVAGEVVENGTPDTKLACEIVEGSGYQVALYDVSGDPSDEEFDDDWKEAPLTGEDTILFGARIITIKLQAELAKDSEVSKSLLTSVRVENPWVEFVEFISPSP